MSEALGGAPEPWRLHDLRRSMATLMGEELEIDTGVMERVLNHISGSQGGLQGVYQRQQYKQKRKAALLAWGAVIERLVSGGDEIRQYCAISSCCVSCRITAVYGCAAWLRLAEPAAARLPPLARRAFARPPCHP